MFNYEPTAYDSFNDKQNVLHNVLSIISKLCFDDEFSENQKATLIESIVLKISHEIVLLQTQIPAKPTSSVTALKNKVYTLVPHFL